MAAPVWLHLRRKRETNLVEFTALRFLDDQPEPRRSPLRLRDLLLFALRVLALLALVAAFAWPYLRGANTAPVHEGTVFAVNGITFEVEEGERLGLVGESGCGKSVTNLAIMRLLPKPAGQIDGGRVMFDGQDLIQLREEEVRDIRGRDIAMIFQDPMTILNPVLTIEEQMVETIQAHKKTSKQDARARAIEILEMVGIPHPETRLKAFPHMFSGGMRQRVMIAMALALEPRLMIADEPTTALDVTIQAQVLELLKRLTTDSGTALILITHDLGVVAGMTQRINVMYAGYIVETATTAELFATPSHPYTVGLLHSIPRLDADGAEELIPIEGRPPDLRSAPVGCPFAPRCAWRLDVCWTDNPILVPVEPGAAIVTSGPDATHLTACHNRRRARRRPPGRPLRDGLRRRAAARPTIDELSDDGATELSTLDNVAPPRGTGRRLDPRRDLRRDRRSDHRGGCRAPGCRSRPRTSTDEPDRDATHRPRRRSTRRGRRGRRAVEPPAAPQDRGPQGLVPDHRGDHPREAHRRCPGDRRRELRHGPRRDARSRRRVGLRQEHDRPGDHPALPADGRPDRLRRDRHRRTVTARRSARCAGGCR